MLLLQNNTGNHTGCAEEEEEVVLRMTLCAARGMPDVLGSRGGLVVLPVCTPRAAVSLAMDSLGALCDPAPPDLL